MKIKTKFLFLVIAFQVILLLPLFAQDFPEVPNPPRLVNDFAGLLSSEEKTMLEQKFVAYNDSTSTQIAIVTITDIGAYEVADYTFQLGEKWKIGTKKNNGVLILVAKQQRKTFIATGYGVESKLTDALCKRIISKVISPQFKQGNFYQGLDNGTTAIIEILVGEFKSEPEVDKPNKAIIIFLVFVIIAALIFLSNRNNRGGGSGGYRRTFGSGGFIPFPFGGGSGFGGGFGGGSSSGGFGGFGGGSFGGGGAGGDW